MSSSVDQTPLIVPLPPGTRIATAADHGLYGVLITTIGFANRCEGIIQMHDNGQLARLWSTNPYRGGGTMFSREWYDISRILVGLEPTRLIAEDDIIYLNAKINRSRLVGRDILDGELKSPTVTQQNFAIRNSPKTMKMSDISFDSCRFDSNDDYSDDCQDDDGRNAYPFRSLGRDLMYQIWLGLDPKPMDKRFQKHHYDNLGSSQLEQVAKLMDKFVINSKKYTPNILFLLSGFGHMQLYMSFYFHCKCIGLYFSNRRYFIALKAHSNMHELVGYFIINSLYDQFTVNYKLTLP